MTVKRDDLLAAATAGVLHYGEVDRLLIFLAQREATVNKNTEPRERRARWKPTHLMYYLAGLLAIGTATLFGTLFAIPEVGAMGLIAVLWFTLLYGVCAIGAAAWFDIRRGILPTGVFAVLVIALTPLGVLALQRVITF
jgi:hypothetical protein